MIEIRTSSSSQRRGFKRDGVRKVVMRPDGGEVRSDLDVGLGKTVQVISFFAYLKEHGIRGPHLVVVPCVIDVFNSIV